LTYNLFLYNKSSQPIGDKIVSDENKNVKCSRCPEICDPDDLIDGMCQPCHEVDTTPTSETCEECPQPAVKNILGVDLCEDC